MDFLFLWTFHHFDFLHIDRFDDESGNWMVGLYKHNLCLLKSSTSTDNNIPDEVNTWEANVDRLNDKWIMSSEIYIKAGTIKLQALDRSTIQYLTIWGFATY